MTDTVNLGLPCIEGSQAQKHVTHNDALRILDSLVQLAVLDRDLSAPPGSLAEGQRWIVKAGATGAWAGHTDAIAAWQDGAWQFSAPQTGWIAYVIDEGTLLAWNGTAWSDFFATVTSLQNLARLGLGTSADANNPLSAKLNNALFTAKTVAEGGDGNLRYKLSKESAAKTLSFLLQDNFSGRAEVGLTGDDDFHFKVSPDGSTWYEGIKIAAASGKVSFPASGGPREMLAANRTYYVRSDGNDGNSGLANNAGGAFLTVQKALDVAVGQIDFAGYTVTIQIADATYAPASGVPVARIRPWTGGGALVIQGNVATPANVVFSATAASAIMITDGALPGPLTLSGLKPMTTTSGNCINNSVPATINIGAFEFGSCAGHHVVVGNGTNLTFTADYKISGGAVRHWYSSVFGWINCINRTITITGTPAFSGAFAFSFFGYMNVSGCTFSGGATGIRYSSNANGIINTAGAGATYLPGDTAGVTASGGQYV